MKTSCCIGCGEPIIGRSDKKFCNESCKSTYHYKQNIESKDSLYRKIDKQLKRNRRILNPDYVLELRDEPLKCNKTATYGDEA